MTEGEPATTTGPDQGEGSANGSIVAEIAREVVQIHARYYGRGPTKAKAIWRNGVIAVILEEIFTRAEEVLVQAGRFDQVRSSRQVFQDQVEPLFCEAIERVTGRQVRAFLSQVTVGGGRLGGIRPRRGLTLRGTAAASPAARRVAAGSGGTERNAAPARGRR